MEKVKQTVENDPDLKSMNLFEHQRYQLSSTLREIRENQGYSQKDIADKTGLTQQMISKIETYNGNPSLDSFLLYCNAIGIDIVGIIRDEFLIRGE